MATKRSAKERRRSRRRAAMVLVPTVAGVFIAGTAFAFWTTTGSGTGQATTGTNTAVTVTQTSTITGLAPGGTAVPIAFKITNSKNTAQYVTSVTIAIASLTKVSDGTAASGCTSADFTLVQPGAINTNVAASTDTPFNSSGASIVMNETGVNQDACKSVNVNLTYTAA